MHFCSAGRGKMLPSQLGCFLHLSGVLFIAFTKGVFCLVALSGSARHAQVWVTEEILVCSHIINRSSPKAEFPVLCSRKMAFWLPHSRWRLQAWQWAEKTSHTHLFMHEHWDDLVSQHAIPLLKDLFSEQKYAVQERGLWDRKLGHPFSFSTTFVQWYLYRGILRCWRLSDVLGLYRLQKENAYELHMWMPALQWRYTILVTWIPTVPLAASVKLLMTGCSSEKEM